MAVIGADVGLVRVCHVMLRRCCQTRVRKWNFSSSVSAMSGNMANSRKRDGN